MSIKITRTLYVGLGGTGVKAILRAKQCFVDAYGDVPPMVAFLAIDTDKGIRDKFVVSRRGKEVKLSDNEICFCGISGSALDIYNQNITQFQWVPKRNIQFLANLRNTGAGQIRSNGRFLARHNAIDISDRVASKVSDIGKPLPLGSRFAYDTDKDGVEYPTKVNIVGSIAGGTGSGMFLDVLVLVAKTLRELGLSYSITPWLVLPDVFRHMNPGPSSGNVWQNAYGAIRELDYLYHLPKNNKNAIDFSFDKVYYLDEGIGDTYLVNNTNRAGVVFQDIDEITDSIGRCMFLPSNEVDSVKDNTSNARFEYNIKDKEAHYVSAGSAEIVYDNQAVGNVIARGIIAQICEELRKSSSTEALKEVNAWMRSEAVAIQEHEADLLIDSILPMYPPFSVVVEKETDELAINTYINAGAEAPNVANEVKSRESEKLVRVKQELDEKLQELLNTQNGAGSVISFLKTLLENVQICKEEMHNETSDLEKELGYKINWGAELSALRKGIFNSFDKDAAQVLQSTITDHIAKKRDLLRHRWAIQFFIDFESYVNEWIGKLTVFDAKIESINKKQIAEIREIQKSASTNSNFQVFLHSDDVDNYDLPEVVQTSALFRESTPISDLIDKSEKELYEILFDFAKELPQVLSAVNVSIEEKMKKMTDSELRRIFEKVKEMSSPLWKTNTHGHLDRSQVLTTIFTIGVYNQSSGFIQNNYADVFTIGSSQPTFASTRQTDRITFFQSQCYSPAYAVNNFKGYARETEEKLRESAYPVSYLDEKLNQRIIADGFDLEPKQEKDKVLPNWVNAIIYGFVKFDETSNAYYIESEQGDILNGGFLGLGQRRDLAFEQFQLKGLDKEVEENIQKMINEKGRPAVTNEILKVKNSLKNYVTQYAQLSERELTSVQAKEEAYQMVIDLLEKEVRYLKEFEV